jgi:hypothetical protein
MGTMATIVKDGTAHGVEPNAIDCTGMDQRADHSSEISSSRETLELSKLNIERDKLELELAQLRALALGPEEQRTKAQNDREKDGLELQKLRHEVEQEARNARTSQYFEIAKVIVPALSIIGSVWAATSSLNYQHNKDRTILVSEQLSHFQENITAPDINKQRNAIAAVRTLGEDAIPSLLANIDLNHPPDIIRALQQAVLELNEAPNLRNVILVGLLSSIKHTALRRDIPHLDYYLELWRKCIEQYKSADAALFQQAVSSGNKLVKDLRQEIEATDTRKADLKAELLNKIDKLATGTGGQDAPAGDASTFFAF